MLPLSGISELLDLRAVTQAARSDGGRQPIWATQALGQPDGRINGGLMLFGSYCECTLMDDAAHEPLRRHHEWCCMHLCSLRHSWLAHSSSLCCVSLSLSLSLPLCTCTCTCIQPFIISTSRLNRAAQCHACCAGDAREHGVTGAGALWRFLCRPLRHVAQALQRGDAVLGRGALTVATRATAVAWRRCCAAGPDVYRRRWFCDHHECWQ